MPQIQCVLATSGVTECDYIEYIPAGRRKEEQMFVTRVRYDEPWFESTLPIVRDFWEEVQQYRNNHPSWNNRVDDIEPIINDEYISPTL